MFAEVTPDAQTLWGVLVTGLFLLTLGEKIFSLMKRGEPQRREVSLLEQYASKAELRELQRHVEKLETKTDDGFEKVRSEMKQSHDQMLQAGESRALEIHKRINQVLTAVSRVEGRFEERGDRRVCDTDTIDK